MNHARITIDPNQMSGLPCIRGLRMTVAMVVDMVAGGMSNGQILKEHPDLKEEDIQAALRYAAETVRRGCLPDTSA